MPCQVIDEVCGGTLRQSHANKPWDLIPRKHLRDGQRRRTLQAMFSPDLRDHPARALVSTADICPEAL